MPTPRTPTPCSAPPLPGWALQLARRATQGRLTTLDQLWPHPELILERAGMTPDRWQTEVLRTRKAQVQLLCSRQVGKTLVAAALALRTALLEPPALVLVLTPSERQSSEFMRRIKELHEALRQPRSLAGPVQSVHEKQGTEADQNQLYFHLPAKTRESSLQLHLDNGSRIIGLPASEGKIRVYSSVALLLIDEASRVDDNLYRAMRPMLAVSRGRLLALSTPFGKRGWFHDAWHGSGDWERVKVTAEQCPRIPADFLAEERQALGERWFRQEYLCSFEDTIDAVFAYADIQAALSDEVKPLFAG
jgi:Terminase large subunit, T4likevirus-type, N-terminal